MATRSTEAVPNEAGQPDQVGGTSQDWTGSGLLAGSRVRHVPGTGGPWRWFFSGVWLVYLIQPVAQLFHSHDVVWIAGGLLITLAFCGIYMPVLMFSDTRPRLAEHKDGQVDAAEGDRDDDAAGDPHRPAVVEQVRDRLDQVNEPDAGEEPAPRAAGARYALLAGVGEQGLLGPVRSRLALACRFRARLRRGRIGRPRRHRSLTSPPCCHVCAGLTAAAPGRAPEWPAGHCWRVAGQTDSAVVRTAAVASATKMPSQTTRPTARPAGIEPPWITSVPIFTAS